MNYEGKGNVGGNPMTKPFTMIAAVIFFAMAIIHAYRIYTHFQVVLGSHNIPIWVSYFGIVIPGLIGIMLLRESKG